MKPLFYTLGRTVLSLYRGMNLVLQFVAFALTYALVASGFDWWYFQHTYQAGMHGVLFSAVIVGFLLPVVFPVTFLLFGFFGRSFRLRTIGFATGQAAILGLAVSSFYKVFTGRVGPHGMRAAVAPLIDISRDFRFGFYRGGAFQGWPSSHTATAFAMSFAVVALFPGKNWKHVLARGAAIAYAFYIGIGVSTNIHWFSDFAAGAIIGAVIGLAVGNAFLRRERKYQALAAV